MNTGLARVSARLLCAVALGMGCSFSLPAATTFTDANWTTLGAGLNGTVYALAVSGSNVYAGGRFTNAGGSAANYVAKWSGSSWSALGSGVGGGSYVFGTVVGALAVSGSNLYAGGYFKRATNSDGVAVTVNYIAKWDGSSWSALGSGMGGGSSPYNGHVYALAVSGNDVYAGGRFTMVTNSGGVAAAANYIAKWNGTNWGALGSGMGGVAYPAVSALAVSGSNLYAGGAFTTAGGNAANSIAKWDGSSWTALGSGLDNVVCALVVSGSNLYAGGSFTTATNSDGVAVTVNYIAKWDGSNWTALGSGLNVSVYALTVSGSDLYAGGYFRSETNNDGVAVTVSYIAKWDGTNWSELGSGMGGGDLLGPTVNALAVSVNDLYAGGDFAMAGGSAANYIARAYLLPLPELSVCASGTNVMLSWPSTNTADFTLEQAGPLPTSASWLPNSSTVADDGTNKSVTLPATSSPQFFRLRGP